MPVLIAAHPSDMDLVVPVATLLRGQGGEVRCYLEDDDHELRNIGCKIAVGSLADSSNLEGALSNVHTFLPIFLGMRTETDLEEFRRFAAAAAAAVPGSDAEQTIVVLPDPELAVEPIAGAIREIEEWFRAHHEPVCVIRTGEIPLPALAEAIVAADDREGVSALIRVPGDLDSGRSTSFSS